MTELRTLKDIELKERGINITDLRTLETLRRYDYNLRAEAIKWIKQANRCGCDKCRHASISFMDFFNITEEDLKGEQEK